MRITCDLVLYDTIYSDTPYIDYGSICIQLFIVTKSLVLDVYGMKTNKHFVDILEGKLVHGEKWVNWSVIVINMKSEILNRLLFGEYLLIIWKSEPHYWHQNYAGCHYHTIKRLTNTIIDRTGYTAYMWLLALRYVCLLVNHTYSSVVKCIPITKVTGSTSDIIPLLNFLFWKPVYYNIYYSDLPSDSTENVVAGLVLQNMLGVSLYLRFLLTKLKRSSSVLIFPRLRNPWNQTFSLTLFVGVHIPHSNITQKGINKVIGV